MLARGGGLAPLWEHVVRTRRLPPDVDAADVLSALDERLGHPEREVRQHALRVLADVVPALAPERLERLMQRLMPGLLACLGHPAPAVRRAALHALQAYVARSPDPDRTLLRLLIPLDERTTVGMLLAIPALLCAFRPTDTTIRRVATALTNASSDSRFHEPAVQSLERVREIFSRRRFTPSPEYRLVAETEMRLPEGDVTVTVIEDDSSDCNSDWVLDENDNFDDDDDCIIKVLSDSSGVSPTEWTSASRRVRFGGECVKLRTPDSDSAEPRSSISETSNDINDHIKRRDRSLIPLPIKPAGTLPAVPQRTVPKRRPSELRPHRPVEVLHDLTRSPRSSPQPPSSAPVEKETGNEVEKSKPEVDAGNTNGSGSDGGESIHADPAWETSGFLEKRVLDDMNDKDWRRRLAGVRALSAALRKPGAVEALEETGQLGTLVRWATSLGGRHPRLAAAAERVVWDAIEGAREPWLRDNCAAIAALGPPGAVRLGAVLMRRLDARRVLDALLQDAAVAHGRSAARRREAALRLVLVAARGHAAGSLSPVGSFAAATAACLDDGSARVRQAALDALAALASVAPAEEIIDAAATALHNRPRRDTMMAAIRARLSRLGTAGPRGRGADADWVAAALDMKQKNLPVRRRRVTRRWSSETSRTSGIPIATYETVKSSPSKSVITRTRLDSAETLRQSSSNSSEVWSEVASGPPSPSTEIITVPSSMSKPESEPEPLLDSLAEANYRQKLTDCRLSRSHADLNDADSIAEARKAISSAPPKQRFSSPEPEPDDKPSKDVTDATSMMTTDSMMTETKSPTEEMPEEKEMSKELVIIDPPVITTGPKRSLVRIVPSGRASCPGGGDDVHRTVALLESTDWETAVRGLKQLTGLVKRGARADSVALEAQVQTVCAALARHVRSLRSQVSRQACLAAKETLEALGGKSSAGDAALEQLAGPLLQRTADTNRFLRADAHSALDSLAKKMGAARVASVASGPSGARHHSAVVRCSGARLLAALARRIGAEKFMALPRETRDRALRAAADLLTDGSQDTRTHAKDLFAQLAPAADKLHAALADAVPSTTMRHIAKTIGNIAPPNRFQTESNGITT